MGLARTAVELGGNGVQVGLAECAEVRALGEVLPQQAEADSLKYRYE